MWKQDKKSIKAMSQIWLKKMGLTRTAEFDAWIETQAATNTLEIIENIIEIYQFLPADRAARRQIILNDFWAEPRRMYPNGKVDDIKTFYFGALKTFNPNIADADLEATWEQMLKEHRPLSLDKDGLRLFFLKLIYYVTSTFWFFKQGLKTTPKTDFAYFLPDDAEYDTDSFDAFIEEYLDDAIVKFVLMELTKAAEKDKIKRVLN